MNRTDLQAALIGVINELNKNLGMFIKSKDISINKLCMDRGINSTIATGFVKFLKAKNIVVLRGYAAATEYKVMMDITGEHIREFLDNRREYTKADKSVPRKPKDAVMVPKTYGVGQMVYTMNNNEICMAKIVSISLNDVNQKPESIKNSDMAYELLVDGDRLIMKVDQFSDRVDGLLSLLKIKYERKLKTKD